MHQLSISSWVVVCPRGIAPPYLDRDPSALLTWCVRKYLAHTSEWSVNILSMNKRLNEI